MSWSANIKIFALQSYDFPNLIFKILFGLRRFPIEFHGGILKNTLKLMAILASSALVLTSCGTSSESAGAKACLALDTGGVDDKSFNASAWAGAQAAAEEAR